MSNRIDYAAIAVKLDYAAVDKKLEQLAQREPANNRKTAMDMLEPLREKLLALYRKDWSPQELTDELRKAGVPISVARLRECLKNWNNGRKKSGKRTGTPAKKSSKPVALPPDAASNQAGRMKGTPPEGQSKFGLNF